MHELARREIEQALGCRVIDSSPLSGGDINDAWKLGLSDGRRIFAKTHSSPPPSMFEAEARGLAWLGQARALRVPEVLAVGSAWLALEYLEPAPARPRFDEELGRGLAALHRYGAPSFGLDHDNFIGRLPQSNRAHSSWAAFYRHERLEPQLDRASAAGRLPSRLRASFDRLFTVLEDRVGPSEPPSRLHGDLWGGNLHTDGSGAPCIIDPAAHGGHREVDLAMMQLFGGFGERVFDAYDEAWPLASDWQERIPLYQLYPLLVHVNLFGSSYLESVARALDAVL
jgi:fructosamine-3-kinase